MAVPQSNSGAEMGHDNGFPRGRPVVRGSMGIAVANHYLTAMSAMRMLLSGGNAFDAAVAAGFAAAVVEPTAGFSLASEGSIMLYHAGSGQLRVLSGQGVAAGRATVRWFKENGLDKIPTQHDRGLSFTVPGVVDAFMLMLEAYGTKTLSEAIAPAIDYARRGFPVYEHMRWRLQRLSESEEFRRHTLGLMDPFYRDGEPLQVGELLVQKQLAATLGKLVEAEVGATGERVAGIRAARDMFYRGEIARTIVRCSESLGGLLSLEDLANYHAKYEEPIRTTYMGYDICAQSTWTQGGVLLQGLNILEHFDLRPMGHNSPQYIHTVTEALKLALADRERYYGDPDYVSVPIDGLLSKEYAANRARLILGEVACPELPGAGDPWRYSAGAEPATQTAARPTTASGHGSHESDVGTTHFAVMDRDGNVVCATPSGGDVGSSPYFPELGCALSTRSEMFFIDPQHPNGLQPGKRPRTTLVNYMVCKDGQPVMTVGCPGADDQAQADLQLILNVLVFGLDPQQAVEAPRFSSQSVALSFYPRVYNPGQLNVEAGIAEGVRSNLAAMGHKIVEAEFCGIGAIVAQREPLTGVMGAGADPRRPTYAIAW